MAKYYTDSFSVDDRKGWIVYLDKALFALHLPGKEAAQPANTYLKKNSLSKKLESYFKGQKVYFNVKIDWADYSHFEKLVLSKCRLIGYGQTATYKDLAKMAKRDGACRAVGNALAKNRLPVIVPCHRIIKSDGSLGGFNSGLKLKKQLLSLEKNGKQK